MDDSCVRWSDLPPELWTVIGKYLDTYIDVLRCRGVCRSLRASFPPFNDVSPALPLHVPSPCNDDADYPIRYSILTRKIIYRLSPLDFHQTDAVSSSAAAKRWFAVVETTQKGKFRFLAPANLSNLQLTFESFRKEVNLLEFRIHELAKSYVLVNTDGVCVPEISKVVMFPDSPWIDAKNCTVLAMYKNGKLGFAKLGDEKWTLIEEHNFDRGDVIACRGQFYAVDRKGIVFSIDSSSMKLVLISPPLCSSGKQKHMVECGGEVYVVDRFDDVSDTETGSSESESGSESEEEEEDEDEEDEGDEEAEEEEEEVEIKVYKVDLDDDYLRRRLEEVENLGNEALFLRKRESSFSVPATDLEGIQGNCIYYARRSMMMKKGF